MQIEWIFGEFPVWISGRASDFDGDGCEDGVEDQDRDNDGIEDKLDRRGMRTFERKEHVKLGTYLLKV